MNNPPIKIIIADDHAVVRDGLQMLLAKNPALQVVAEAQNGEQLIQMARQFEPDVILTDLKMPGTDGIQAIREIHAFNDRIRIVALSYFEREDMVVKALEAGAIGYVVKNAQRGEIEDAILTVYNFQPYYCRSTSTLLFNLIASSSFNPYQHKTAIEFTAREKEIIKYICAEKSSEEIADILCVGIRTVESDRRRINKKMNVRTPAGVALYAVKNGLFYLD